jgi:hypothetical protein
LQLGKIRPFFSVFGVAWGVTRRRQRRFRSGEEGKLWGLRGEEDDEIERDWRREEGGARK